MRLFLCLVLSISLWACQSDTARYPYTLKDFRPAIREHLQLLVTSGSLNSLTSSTEEFLQKHASDGELLKMTQSEHPLVRAFALGATLDRPEMDHYSLLMEHLDDTAMIAWYARCASNPHEYVADHFIFKFNKWKSIEQKQKVIHEVLTRHNNLSAAYAILHKVAGDPKYYDIVREMADRPIPTYLLEHAWRALAQYKKPEDIIFLREAFTDHSFDYSETPLLIVSENPDTAYFPVLTSYVNRRFFRDIWDEKWHHRTFFGALAKYKDQTSVDLIEHIFKGDKYYAKNGPRRITLTDDILFDLYQNLQQNRCKAYEPLIARLEPLIAGQKKQLEDWEKNGESLTVDTLPVKEASELDHW